MPTLLVAVTAALAALGLRVLLQPVLDGSLSLVALPASVALMAYWGGWHAAAVTAVLGFVLSHLALGGPWVGEGMLIDLFACLAVIAAMAIRQLRGAVGRQRALMEERRTLEESRSRLAAIVEASDDAIVSKSLAGIIQSWNAGAERILGYRADEVVGQHITTIIPPELRPEEDEIIRRIRRGERMDHFETVRLHKDGHRIDLSITVSPVFDERGRVIGASKVARDISDRKQMEASLQEADRRKDEFLATLSHELRNPLAPISHSLEILKQAAIDEKLLAQARQTIERQMAQMVRLVDDLLNISRISRDKLRLRKSVTSIAAVVEQAVETVRPLAEQGGQTLEVQLPEEDLRLMADPARLSQVLSNLLHNACKFTEVGGHIAVVVGRQGSELCLAVRDDGVGIAAEQLTSIFEMFTQSEQTLTRSASGLGIGLTLAKRLVEMHGGRISAHSEGLGKGSEFRVVLPLHEGAAASAAPGPQPIEVLKPASFKRMLVVDDNHDSAQSLATLLSLNGHEVQQAHDGEEALRIADAQPPEVILLDIGLPGIDGYEVCRRIRRESWGEAIKVVAITGWGQEQDRAKTRAAGFDAHLVKPVQFDQLNRLLAEFHNTGEPAAIP